jgi:LacI family transcriptional regulator
MLHSLASIAHTLESSFRATLERGRATFWLCANDAVAVAATSFLHRHGVSVPHDIEVAGFDNSPFAFAQRITSYDFGTDRAGVIAARCLANPDWSPRDPDGFIRLPGRVVVRETASGSGTHTGKTSMEGRDGGRGEPFGGP